jgi:hypothetical protein
MPALEQAARIVPPPGVSGHAAGRQATGAVLARLRRFVEALALQLLAGPRQWLASEPGVMAALKSGHYVTFSLGPAPVQPASQPLGGLAAQCADSRSGP